MPLLAIASGKGGVGKTTCAVNLCAAFRELGHDPVLLDADSGGDATWLLGFRSADTALDALRGRKDLTAAVSSTTEGIRLLASSPRLIELETADVNVLAERLRRLSDRYLIVADLPPGFSPAVTRAAILAATTIVVPIIPEPLAERRARHVLDAAEALGSTATILALAVMVDKRRVLTGAVLATAQEGGLDVVGAIPRSVAVPESGNEGVSVLRYAPASAAAAAFREVAPRILQTLTALVR
jgi:cellulose biosynthesis protein BcsQ